MWRLYTKLLFVMTGKETDIDGGYGLEFIDRAMITIINYICKDSEAFQQNRDPQDPFLPPNSTYI